jgi:RNA polymerase sigma-70 factor (ECF subfamily)
MLHPLGSLKDGKARLQAPESGWGKVLAVSWDRREERQLVEAAQAGDVAAFRRLYDHYLPIVYARVCALVPRIDAEDVTQEVILSVARSMQGYRGRSAFSTWVNSILRRRVADYYRRAARRVPQVPLSEGGDVPAVGNVSADDVSADYASADSVPAAGNARESHEVFMVRQVFVALPATQREVILLRLVEGLPFQEVALRLGIETGAAKMRFYRAIAACREGLAAVTFATGSTTNEVKGSDD